jgi:hypothetical protein
LILGLRDPLNIRDSDPRTMTGVSNMRSVRAIKGWPLNILEARMRKVGNRRLTEADRQALAFDFLEGRLRMRDETNVDDPPTFANRWLF